MSLRTLAWPPRKRDLHGALAKESPYQITPERCVVCSALEQSSCTIRDGICAGCWAQGWRPPTTATDGGSHR